MRILLRFFLAITILQLSESVLAQNDSTYVHSYDTMLTSRFYFSQKYVAFIFKNLNNQTSLNYRPNTTLNMGVGVTYGSLTLNLAYGFDFLNLGEEQKKGKTKYLDLQGHFYSRKITIDFLGQFYNGFYLNDDSYREPDGSYYQRPDIQIREFGVKAQYVLNHKRFSYRASLLHNDWQKKSAGSLLLGFEIYGGTGKADSTFTPTATGTTKPPIDPQRLGFFEVGPNIGYAYTLVVHKHFYISGSVAASIVFGSNKISSELNDTRSNGISSNSFYRAFAGYNGPRWATGVSWVNSQINIASTNASIRTVVHTGNVRASFVYRFSPGPKLYKLLPRVKPH